MAKRLLVVDDDPGLLLAVSETLRAEGYQVATARRGAEALVRVAEALVKAGHPGGRAHLEKAARSRREDVRGLAQSVLSNLDAD